jgi:hypothetical protein
VTRLWAERSGDRIPVGARNLSTLRDVRAGSWGPSSLDFSGYRNCSDGVKRARRESDHFTPSSVSNGAVSQYALMG